MPQDDFDITMKTASKKSDHIQVHYDKHGSLIKIMEPRLGNFFTIF